MTFIRGKRRNDIKKRATRRHRTVIWTLQHAAFKLHTLDDGAVWTAERYDHCRHIQIGIRENRVCYLFTHQFVSLSESLTSAIASWIAALLAEIGEWRGGCVVRVQVLSAKSRQIHTPAVPVKHHCHVHVQTPLFWRRRRRRCTWAMREDSLIRG